jgi:hypothetical protein
MHSDHVVGRVHLIDKNMIGAIYLAIAVGLV